MRALCISYIVTIILALSHSARGQGFANLNFERSIVVSSNYDQFGNDYGIAYVPGWSGFGTNLFLYNQLSLGTPSVTLVGGSLGAIDGAFSMQLEAFTTASISVSSQASTVPTSAESLMFKAQPGLGVLVVTLGGQNIPIFALSNGANYTLYGGNISTFAGEAEQLTFTAIGTGGAYYGANTWTIDDIIFSSSPVPEPSILNLFSIGVCFFVWNKLRPNQIR